MSGRNIVGKTWISVGIQDDTQAALTRMQSNMRRRMALGPAGAEPIFNGLSRKASGPGGPERGGSGLHGGFFTAGHQLAFMIEDMSVVYAQTGKISHTIRAGANNLTMMALALGGTKALYASIGAILALQILPMITKWVEGMGDINSMLAQQKALIERGRLIRGGTLDREQTLAQIEQIQTPWDAATRQQGAEFRRRRLADVDRPAIDQEIKGLESFLRIWKQRAAESERNSDIVFDPSRWAESAEVSRTLLEALGGLTDPSEQVALIEKELAEARTRGAKAAEELKTTEYELLELERRRLETNRRVREQQQTTDFFEGLDLVKSMRDQADELTGPLDLKGERRKIEEDRIANQIQLLEAMAGGLDGMDSWDGLLSLNDRLAELKNRALDIGKPNLELPGSLQQGTIEAARQAEMNRRNQYDPQVRELLKLRDEAIKIRDILQQIIGLVQPA